MKQITRNEANYLLRKFGAIDTKVEHIKNVLIVCSILSNDRSLLVKYDVKKHQKSYYIEN